MKLVLSKLFIIFCFFSSTFDVCAQLDLDDSLAFNQRYYDLLNLPCDTPPIYQDFEKNRRKRILKSNIDKLLFQQVDEGFFKEIMHPFVMVNEDHYFPQNRIFIHKLIRHFLADTNYYFFFEALGQDIYVHSFDTLSPCRHFGFYLGEPQMAENIRLILKNNRNVYAYESQLKYFDEKKYFRLGLQSMIRNDFYDAFLKRISPDDKSFLKYMNIRDMNQFVNFYEKCLIIRKRNPKAKFIIFCGHGHLKERKGDSNKDISWNNLAYLLINYLNIDPTTVELTNLTEKCIYEKNMYYDTIRNLTNSPDFYYVCSDSLLKYGLYPVIQAGMNADYVISSPRIEYANNRETWLRYDGKKDVLIEEKWYVKNRDKVPILKAYYKNENPEIATAADILYIHRSLQNYFVLYPGDYNIYLDGRYLYSITVN